MQDLIFDIKEFGLHDGSGLRTTVFLKGCPLKCIWCHNPEGQRFGRETARNTQKCKGCGLCQRECAHPECEGLGACVKVCPENNVRAIGTYYEPEALAKKLLKNRQFLQNGGITFSGGEPLCHGEYILEVIKHLEGIKTAVETCGYVENFLEYTDRIDDIFMDIKLIDDGEHMKYTGVSNKLILENAQKILARRPVTVRIPLIPSVTDRNENLEGISEFLEPYKSNVTVELIPYNKMTGAKYATIGRKYEPCFDEQASINKNILPFSKKGIRIKET